MKKENDIPRKTKSFYADYGKRALDLCISSVALAALSPVLLVTAILLLVFQGRPICYISRRPGLDGKLFSIYKFRTMSNRRDETGKLLPGSQRITKIGKFLRRTSIDELPELFNIIKGDMAIVGPRPLLPEYMELYSNRHLARQEIRPGLACVWVRRGRPPVVWGWMEQFENDVWYLEHISLWTDMKMIAAILKEAVRGSKSRTEDTRGRFKGYEKKERAQE